MDFTTIGTLGSYVKQKNMKFAADYRKKTGQSLVNSTGNLKLDLKAANNRSLVDKMLQAQQQDENEYSKQRVSTIKKKLLNGKKISNEELGYLRKHDPVKAEEAREELKAALRKAKTKDEARQAVTRAIMKASAEAAAELKFASGGGVSGAGANGVSGAVPAGYEASQEIGGANAEAIQAYVNGDEPSMVRLNEQINSASLENTADNVNNAELQEASALKDINTDIAASNEINAKTAVENTAAQTDAMINKPNAQSSNPNDKTNSSKNDITSGIIEKFIMVVRAIEDEWTTFAKSDEYKDLAENYFEESEIELNGKHKRKKQNVIKVPNQQVIDAITTYRKSMMFDAGDNN